MKATTKKLTTYGNLGLVQLRVEPLADFKFRPGGPELKTGGLVISESSGQGIVGELLAINNTEAFLLLTDADVLVGAKQNRVLNKSILLAPLSKTVVDVSCIERLRWHYTSGSFSSPQSVADPDLRKEKASTLSFMRSGSEDQKPDTQRTVWSHVNDRIMEAGCASKTESYADLINYRMKSAANDFPKCEPERGCNGLAIVLDRKIISADLFGSEDVYSHYFPMLRDSAFRMAVNGKKVKAVDQHEAFFKALDLIDNFEAADRHRDGNYSGAGLFNLAETTGMIGAELLFDGQLIHTAIFGKQS